MQLVYIRMSDKMIDDITKEVSDELMNDIANEVFVLYLRMHTTYTV